ncbi:metallopeptidase [Streptomyces albus subsp. albus]|nr:metallopeptidase [Streptomyces albus subsp. albus]
MPRRSPLRALCGALLMVACAACSGGSGSAEEGGHGKPGAAGVGDPLFPSQGNGGYDVTHYGLTLDYQPDSGRLKGSADITARATGDLRSFNLDLDGLRVRDASVDGVTAKVSRHGSELTITPKSPLAKGRIFRTDIRYDGKPKTLRDPDGSVEGWVQTDDGAVGLGEPNGSMTWFPANNHPSDKAAYDISVTLPDNGKSAVSNGELTSREVTGDHRTFSWRMSEPMASYLVTVAIGDFQITDTTTDSGLPEYDAVDYDELDKSAEVGDQVSEILGWETKLFGPYPFSTTGVIVDHNPSVDYALETQSRPYFHAAPDPAFLVHEFAHQWFGDSVTPRTWKDIWLNEGFATYAEWLWEEKKGGRDTDRIFRDMYSGKDRESEGIWAFPPGNPPSGTKVMDSPVYGRGAMVLHKLRKAVGDDTFFGILRSWTAAHRHGTADTRQFIALCEKKAHRDLGPLFDVWLYGKGKPARP